MTVLGETKIPFVEVGDFPPIESRVGRRLLET